MAHCTYFLVFIALLPSVLCCGKVNVALVEANTKCADGSPSVFQITPDFGFTLTEDCVLQPAGCIEMTKDCNSAKVHYKLSTNVVPLTEDEHDGCDLMKNATKNKEIDTILTLFQFPKSCPITAGKVCAEGKTLSLAQYKDKMMFASGTIKGEATVDHKEAGKSCLNFVINVTPKPLSFN